MHPYHVYMTLYHPHFFLLLHLVVSRKFSFLAMSQVGHAVVQLVEALPYKPEGRRFDFRWCHFR